MQPPSFTDRDKPPEIVAEAGAWLATQIGDGYVYIRSKRELVRKSPGRAETIGLQTSSWSRTGQGTWVNPRLTVTDARVKEWQAARQLKGLFSTGGQIFNTLLINLGLHDVELHGPLRRVQPDLRISLGEFADTLRRDVLPNVELMRDGPAAAAERLPIAWIVFPQQPFWWAIAYGDRVAAKRFLARFFEANPNSRKQFETGRALASAAAEPDVNNSLVDLGWSAVRAGALTVDEQI